MVRALTGTQTLILMPNPCPALMAAASAHINTHVSLERQQKGQLRANPTGTLPSVPLSNCLMRGEFLVPLPPHL